METINNIKRIIAEEGLSQSQLARMSGLAFGTINRILSGKQVLKPNTLAKIAEALSVSVAELQEEDNANWNFNYAVQGYLQFADEITRITSFKQLKDWVKKYEPLVNEKPKKKKAILATEKKNAKKVLTSNLHIEADEIDFYRKETIDATKDETWSFRKAEDERDGNKIDLGNMCISYHFDCMGHTFTNSEALYICGLFSNDTKKHSLIQQKLIEAKSGYDAKKAVRKKYEDDAREDWNTFNVEYMKWAVWQKIKGNEDFRNTLTSIPREAYIIENSTHQTGETALFWGMSNKELEDARSTVEECVGIENPTATSKELERLQMEERNKVNHIGVWEGVNCMGKILKYLQLCLLDGKEPQIDYDLLRSKQIYLFGQLLTFEDAPKTSQKPIKAKPKEVVAETKKEAQEGDELPENRVKGIIGAVIGDIVGSRFEFYRMKGDKIPTHYKLFAASSSLTDDTVLTMAVADALLHKKEFRDTFWTWAKRYPHAGFGRSFKKWLKGGKDLSNDSKGNGCGMRVSPVGFYAKSLEETLELARQSAIISHNSEEGIRGAQSIAAATYMAKEQKPKDEIKRYIEHTFGYNLDQTDEEIETKVAGLTRSGERELAENTCPLAIIAFLTTDDFESAIRKAISYSCDTDSVACMAGGIASAYYGVPQSIIEEVQEYLPQEFIDVINEFDGIDLHNTRTTPKDCHRWGDILVYGSGDNKNGETEGFTAAKYFGAGKILEGMDKRAYAIPTVGRSLDEIRASVDRFFDFAAANPDKTFLITRVGCSKAGYSPKDIAPMFRKAQTMTNVYLPMEFKDN